MKFSTIFLKRAICGFCFVLFAKASWDLAMRGWYEIVIPYDHDGLLFAGMGRGLLNGLILYEDLFDLHQPGIILLSALSLHFFHTMGLVHAAEAAILVAIPCVVAFGASFILKGNESRPLRWIGIAAAWIFGASLALYATQLSDYVGGLRPEIFGAFFGILYVVLLVEDDGRESILLTVVRGVLLFLAICFVLPLLFSTLAGALLLSRTFRSFVKRFIVPLCFVPFFSIALLWGMGSIRSYFFHTIPFVLLYQKSSMPLVLRALSVDQLWGSLHAFSPFLGAVVVLLLVGTLLLPIRLARAEVSRYFLVLASTVVLVIFLYRFFREFPFILSLAFHSCFSGSQCFLFPFGALYFSVIVFLFFIWSVSLVRFWVKTKRSQRTLILKSHGRALAGLYLGGLTVSISIVFGARHLPMVLPVYVAFFLLFLQYASLRWQSTFTRSFFSVMVFLVVCSTLIHRNIVDVGAVRSMEKDVAPMVEAAALVDETLRRCNLDRYLPLVPTGTLDIVGYTEHSPSGLVLYEGLRSHIMNIPSLHEKMVRELQESHLIVLPAGIVRWQAHLPFSSDEFTEEPWPCAQHLVPSAEIRMLFRVKKGSAFLPRKPALQQSSTS